jgi:hypothetical protein
MGELLLGQRGALSQRSEPGSERRPQVLHDADIVRRGPLLGP